jgi:hypothetical protein
MTIPPDQHDLYAEFGVAAEKAQALEIAAGNVALSFLAVWVKKDEITPEVSEFFRSIVDDCNRSTLGKLLKQIKSIGSFDDAIIRAVDEALERRNYLVHKFFRTHNFAISSEDGRREMRTELREIQIKLDYAHALLVGISGVLDQLGELDHSGDKILLEELQARGKRVDI